MYNELPLDFNTMYKAYRVSLTNRSYKTSSMYFRLDAVNEIQKLKKELQDRTYKISKYTVFYVKEPKVREIKACKFRDKVVQHIVCDNIMKPMLPQICIKDNYAGQTGKGTAFARSRLQQHMRNFEFQCGTDGWIFKGDVSKYYYNINHQDAIDIMNYHFPECTHWLTELFINSTEGDVGVALGNQINTVVSCVYLDGLDRFITGELGLRYYSRYADDFLIIHHDKEYLKYCVECIVEFLDTLGLKLNPKSQIIKYKTGVTFIGFHFNPNGEIKMDNAKRRGFKRKFNKMCKLVSDGKIDISELEKSYTSWKEHAKIVTDKRIFNYFDKRLKEVKNGIK